MALYAMNEDHLIINSTLKCLQRLSTRTHQLFFLNNNTQQYIVFHLANGNQENSLLCLEIIAQIRSYPGRGLLLNIVLY